MKFTERVVPTKEHQAVFLGRSDDQFWITFTARVEPENFVDGKLLPRAFAFRHKKQMYTRIPVTKESASALKKLLNEVRDL